MHAHQHDVLVSKIEGRDVTDEEVVEEVVLAKPQLPSTSPDGRPAEEPREGTESREDPRDALRLAALEACAV